jgi:hypothetical protein
MYSATDLPAGRFAEACCFAPRQASREVYTDLRRLFSLSDRMNRIYRTIIYLFYYTVYLVYPV